MVSRHKIGTPVEVFSVMAETLPINRLQHHNKHSSDNVTLLLLGMTRTDRRDGLRGSVADHGLAAVAGSRLDLSEAGGAAR